MVAIKDMKMPSCCSECEYIPKYCLYCLRLHQGIPRDIFNKSRLSNCPLVEIQERKEEKWIPVNSPYDNVQEHKVVTQREVIYNLNTMNDELQAKLDKIEQITDKWITLEENSTFCMREIREVLNG